VCGVLYAPTDTLRDKRHRLDTLTAALQDERGQPGSQGRSLPHLIETIGALEARGVGFKSVQENIDTTTPGGRLIFHVFGALASFELELVRERTMAGLAAARARGRTGGRPSVMTPSKLKQATRMVSDGLPLTEIAQVLGLSRSTLYRHIEGAGTSTSRGGVPQQ